MTRCRCPQFAAPPHVPGALSVKLLRVKLTGTLFAVSVPRVTEAPDSGAVIMTEALLPPPPLLPPQAAAKKMETIANLPPIPSIGRPPVRRRRAGLPAHGRDEAGRSEACGSASAAWQLGRRESWTSRGNSDAASTRPGPRG